MKNSSSMRVVYPRNIALTIDRISLESARYLVRKVNAECQWFFQMHKISETDKSIHYHLSDFIVPKQLVTGATVETTSDSMETLFRDIAEERGGFGPASEVVNNMTMWCHSHVNMGVSPSGTDNQTFEDFIKSDAKDGLSRVQAMMIFNKKDDIFTRIYDPTVGLMFENVELIPYDQVDNDAIDALIKKNVQNRPSAAMVRHQNFSSHGYVGNRPATTFTRNANGTISRTTSQNQWEEAQLAYVNGGWADDFPELDSGWDNLDKNFDFTEDQVWGMNTSIPVPSLFQWKELWHADRAKDIEPLVNKISRSSDCTKEVDELNKLVFSGMSTKEIGYLLALLDGTDTEMEALKNVEIHQAFAKENFVDNLPVMAFKTFEEMVVAPSVFMIAMEVASELAILLEPTDQKARDELVSTWMLYQQLLQE